MGHANVDDCWCIGYAPSRGRRCHNRTNNSNRHMARRAFKTIGDMDPESAEARDPARLAAVARMLLCWQHGRQAEDIARRWAIKIGRVSSQLSDVNSPSTPRPALSQYSPQNGNLFLEPAADRSAPFSISPAESLLAGNGSIRLTVPASGASYSLSTTHRAPPRRAGRVSASPEPDAGRYSTTQGTAVQTNTSNTVAVRVVPQDLPLPASPATPSNPASDSSEDPPTTLSPPASTSDTARNARPAPLTVPPTVSGPSRSSENDTDAASSASDTEDESADEGARTVPHAQTPPAGPSPPPVAIPRPRSPAAPSIPPPARYATPATSGRAHLPHTCADRHAPRHSLPDNCSICLEPMRLTQPLSWCKRQCGQNFHRECFDEWRRGVGQHVRCPYCRAPWGRACAHDEQSPVAGPRGIRSVGDLSGVALAGESMPLRGG